MPFSTEKPVTERVEHAGVTLQVERRGPIDGPLALLHPGAGADHTALLPLARFLSGQGYTTLTPDPRGVGGSDRPEDGYDVDTMASDARAVLDAYGRRPALLLGQSLGSAVVQRVALQDPARAAGLILLATWVKSDGFLEKQFDLVHALVSAHPPEVYGPALLYLIVSRPYVSGSEADVRGLLAGMFTGRRATSKAILLRHLGAGRNHDTSSLLPDLRVPSLVLTGERDFMIPKEYGEEAARLLPKAHLVTLTGPKASHLFHWEMEAEVHGAVASFLGTLAGAP